MVVRIVLLWAPAFAVACASSDGGTPRTNMGSAAIGGSAVAGNGGSAGAGQGAASGATGGVAGSTIDDGCSAITESAVNQRQPADIIFAIDNSGSMDEEIVFVREQMNAFSQQIVDSGVDVRIIVISKALGPPSNDEGDQDNGICIDPPLGSGDCPDDSNPPRYLHVAEEVDSNDALNLIIDTYDEWKDQLRPNATKTFVVVTDDDATDEPNDSAATFTQAVAELDPVLFEEWSFSGIYCFSECPEAAEIGLVYIDLVAQQQGVGGDLCLQNFAPVFDALAVAVIGASGLECEWEIPDPPAGETFAVGQVNVQYTPASGPAVPIYHVSMASECTATGGWYYNDNTTPTRLLVCPTTCDTLRSDENGTLDVLFGCETRDRPD